MGRFCQSDWGVIFQFWGGPARHPRKHEKCPFRPPIGPPGPRFPLPIYISITKWRKMSKVTLFTFDGLLLYVTRIVMCTRVQLCAHRWFFLTPQLGVFSNRIGGVPKIEKSTPNWQFLAPLKINFFQFSRCHRFRHFSIFRGIAIFQFSSIWQFFCTYMSKMKLSIFKFSSISSIFNFWWHLNFHFFVNVTIFCVRMSKIKFLIRQCDNFFHL